MRISPKNLSPAEAIAKAKANAKAKSDANAQARDVVRRETLAGAPIEEDGTSSPDQIDARRAQQLLERASALAERGDMGAAVLATRQALALAPTNVDGHLQLAGLLERNRDFGGARDAYQKSAQLAPERAEASDNLKRLNTYLENSQGAARQFQFDADELFAPAAENNIVPVADANSADNAKEASSDNVETSEKLPESAPVVVAPITATPASAPLGIDSMAIFDESMLPPIEARLPPSRGETAVTSANDQTTVQPAATNGSAPAQSAFMAQSDVDAAALEFARPENNRRQNNVPVATERRRRAAAAPVLLTPMAPAAPRPTVVAPAVAAPAVAAPAVALTGTAGTATAATALGTTASPVRVENPVAAPLAARAPSVVQPVVQPATTRASDNILDLHPSAPPARVNVPLALDVPAAPAAPLWQQVVARPSFYARTLPLVGVALLSLGFLSWARGRAVSQVVAPTEIAQVQVQDAQLLPDQSAQVATVPGTTLPVPNNPAVPSSDAGGFPISNAPATFQAPPATTSNATATTNESANNNAPQTTARANNRGPNSGSNSRPRTVQRILPPARPVPSFPGVSLAPAPIPPASVRNTNSGANAGQSGGNNIILPRPSIDLPAPTAPRQRVLPPSDNGLNPAGSPNRGYVRITEGRVGNGVIPTQPSGAARQNENDANDSARNGQTDQAISQLSQAIRADSENAGFRYQQRAMLFLQRGDYNRASDDFQSAISAYQNQINNGDDVAQAKRGLSSARSGLNLALAGKRGG